MQNKGLDIKKWAEEDRPREKLLLKGKAVLSDAELLGILLGSGATNLTAVDVGKLILKEVDYNLNKLARLTAKDLMKFRGVGEAKAVTIISALELGRRRQESQPDKTVQVRTSKHIYNLMKPLLLDLPNEEFWVIHLNRANHVIHKQKISSGGVSGTVADPKIIFKSALEHTASSIVLVHNHPSGNLEPSAADKQLTNQMKKAGLLLEISLIDHIIFSDTGFFSFADENLL